MDSKRVAVVGSGISGLSAAWLLHRNGAKVTLFESEASCGGHTLTDTSSGFPVDLGFQVYNLTTYPHLVGLFEELGVETQPSEMSFALSMDGGKLEWGSHSLDTVFAQRSNLANPAFLSMIRDVIRFGRESPEVLRPESEAEFARMTLGQYLELRGYSAGFRDHYVAPMCAAVWSVPNAQVLDFPVRTLIRFWVNHHLLDLYQRPCWRVVSGRSKTYVDRITAELPDVRTSSPVQSVRSLGPQGPVQLTVAGAGEAEEFDVVLLATHSDISLRMLGAQGPKALRDVLEAIPYNDNDIFLHTDESLMPVCKKTWASWNFLGRSADGGDKAAVCVSYWANRLQPLPPGAPNLFVTLNPIHPPAEDKTFRRLSLAHPVFSFASDAAQRALPEAQGQGGIWLAGAWAGYGFHEDGIKSAVDAVTSMGCTIPWVPRSVSPKIGLLDQAAIRLFDKFARAAIKTGYLRIVLPNGDELVYGEKAHCAAPVPKGEEWRGRPALSATVRLFSPSFFRKVITRHDTGMGEAYMDGDYEVDNWSVCGMGEAYMDGDYEVDSLGGLLAVATANANNIEANRGMMGAFNWLGDRLLAAAHAARSNTLEGSRKNIEEHYDAGNDMYKLFLDASMTYSCGIWAKDCDLHQSQLNKLDALIDKAEIKEGDHVLEVGCGWGSFAMRAAQRTGCRVTGITVSKEQLAEATARVKAAGLADRVTLMFCDYRECPGAGTYDKVVSCEMIEAVGHEHMEAYFRTLGAMVKPGGRVVIQVIAEPDERYEAYCKSSDFIREHIFPGGHLPCMGVMVDSARGTGLSVHGCEDIGPDYAVTLRAWRQAWEEQKEAVLALGYSERFWRKYRFYFAYCEAAFDAKYIHTYQVTWVKDKEPTLTAADLQRSIDMSKGIHAPGGSIDCPGGLKVAPTGSDPVNQVLLCLYCFLAGVAVSTGRLLWLLPLATAAAAALHWAAGAASQLALPFYKDLPAERAALWRVDATHLSYSSLTAVLVTAFFITCPSALRLSAPPAAPGTWCADLPQALIVCSAGFFAFVLWAEVAGRLYRASYRHMAHFTLLLILFAAAAYKSEHTAFMALTLLSEVNSTCHLACKMLGTAASSSGTDGASAGAAAAALTAVDRLTFVAFRLVPHALLGLLVLFQPGAFASWAYYFLALGGMAYMNVTNVRRAVDLLIPLPAGKAHLA
ncbi:cyclopropane-fatty-acyl-phospholipid synthase [Chlorella sorokiniana]|uniref:Cyclopropane-fatty-acyl-phospholipid synthase n=1 Tax=Chlorella sorokiniana TaxID=3076 RepID=A0A2P6U2Z1_CHLSO|nr:cyclopropane-fatty-acyl-phospholipid synthase [Chlorella sorokiniana]|eukprot:PRW60674.1 cyclopropane-fatty-acyl-phospholipid synthase [Chlorella sorokiniana]